MAHNNNKIGAASPNREGVITPQLNDLDNVSINAASSNQVLKWNSSNSTWENGAPPASTPYMFIGAGESNDYSNTGNTGAISSGDAWYLYDTSPQNNIPGATITKIASTDWIDYVTLPAGHYIVDAQFYATWTASGYLTAALYHSTNSTPSWGTRLSANGYIGATLNTNAISNVITGHFEITSTMVSNGQNNVRMQVVTSSNLAPYSGTPSQGTTPAEFNYLFLRQVTA